MGSVYEANYGVREPIYQCATGEVEEWLGFTTMEITQVKKPYLNCQPLTEKVHDTFMQAMNRDWLGELIDKPNPSDDSCSFNHHEYDSVWRPAKIPDAVWGFSASEAAAYLDPASPLLLKYEAKDIFWRNFPSRYVLTGLEGYTRYIIDAGLAHALFESDGFRPDMYDPHEYFYNICLGD